MLRAWLELARISNLPTVWSNVLAAWLLSGQTLDQTLIQVVVGTSVIYTAGMILNDAADARWDRTNKPERPIPSGRVAHSVAWIAGLGGLVLGAALCATVPVIHWGWLIALCAAVIAYDIFHKPWAGSVIVMGSCRTFLYLAVGGLVILRPALALGIYVVALSLLARAEGKGSPSPVTRTVLVLLLLVPLWTSISAQVMWMLPAAGFSALVWLALRQMRQGGPAIGNAVGWLLAGMPLVDALALASSSANTTWVIALCCLPPILRYWQRFVAAT